MDDHRLLRSIRCVQRDPDDGVCRGMLTPSGETLDCESCGYRYRVVRGVPILRDGSETESIAWFEQVYAGRSRTEELTSDYLLRERTFMAEFARRWDLHGPCLEIGCGTGLFAETVPQYIGLEYALESLLAGGFEAAARVCGDARLLPFADASMECVFSFNTLEHVDELDVALAEIDRVLRPGGMLVLKPAWHCTRYTTELIPVRAYRDLNARQKFTKALLPVFRSRPYKLLTWTPWRLLRRLTCQPGNPLRWTRLTPYYGEDWISDADASSGIDCHEAILYFTSRDYACHSHRSALSQVLAGHDIVVLRKGNGSAQRATSERGGTARLAVTATARPS
jgi:SAM-dependent methyltransferase